VINEKVGEKTGLEKTQVKGSQHVRGGNIENKKGRKGLPEEGRGRQRTKTSAYPILKRTRGAREKGTAKGNRKK